MGLVHQIRKVEGLVPAVPDVGAGSLPQSYASARQALAECDRIDECQSWADKAAALASYAEQAKDDELLRTATRIRDRAVRRAGELLKQISPGKTGPKSKDSADSGPDRSRKNAAEAAGLSRRQAVTAIRVASIPASEFERQVESDKPPTITALAAQGTATCTPADAADDPAGRTAHEIELANSFLATITRCATDLAKIDLGEAPYCLSGDQCQRAEKAIASICNALVPLQGRL